METIRVNVSSDQIKQALYRGHHDPSDKILKVVLNFSAMSIRIQ